MEIEALVHLQHQYFKTHQTHDLAYRKQALKKLRTTIISMEDEIHAALKKDLNKSEMESYMSETGMVVAEITYQLRHLEKWAKPKTVHTPLAQFYAKSYTIWEPYGVVLVMAPWNYPFQLCLEPAIGAIAAGNTVIIKPSAYAQATSNIIAKLIRACFLQPYVAVVEGGRDKNTELLEQRFDFIFFTGSAHVGKIVMEKASRYVTPIALELGGKSPCIVDESASLKIAAKRIAFGKFLNAGQTCVAPDYVFVQKLVKNEFLTYVNQALQMFFKGAALNDANYPKIINEKHFQRLLNLLKDSDICIGGTYNRDTLQIAPTLVEIDYTKQHPLMQEEIFGPILPILVYENLEDVVHYINDHEHPLALYVFTKRKQVESKILRECCFGGGCINDTIIHLATSHMGFGGVGQSGMGNYHGQASFTTFSHSKSIVKKATWLDLKVRYHPYTKTKEKIVRLLLK